MELKEFVAQTLIQIIEGVVEAQKGVSHTGALVNPTLRNVMPQGEKNYASIGWAAGQSGNPVLMVKFDVAVTTTEGTKTKSGIGVVTGILSLGSTGATDKADSAATRLAFQVPLMLPGHPTSSKSSA